MSEVSTGCPLCLPRSDSSAQWIKICTLSVSTLYLDRNQTYRGHSQLIYDKAHRVGRESLSATELQDFMADVQAAAQAISKACTPDRMNYMSLGNVVAHLHWHLVPRYRTDPRWGSLIYTTEVSDMRVTHLAESEYCRLVDDLRAQLPASGEA